MESAMITLRRARREGSMGRRPLAFTGATLLAVATAFFLAACFPASAKAQTVGADQSSFANVVVFVQFADSGNTFMQDPQDVADVRRYYVDATFPKSLVSYVDAISYGQLHVETLMPQYDAEAGTITPVTLSRPRDSYASATSNYDLVTEAIDALQSTSVGDGALVDYTGDGYIDNLTFVLAGGGDDRGGVLTPRKEDYEGRKVLYGKSVRTINVLADDRIFGESTYDRYGVICHEFLHSLGYPDLYKETGGSPVGMYDLMSTSSNFLQYPLAYLRSSVTNWLTIDTITPDNADNGGQAFTLVAAGEADGDQAYILRSPLSDTEFFVVEYRKRGAQFSDELEVKIPGDGLIVYRINTRVERLNNRTSAIDGVYVFRPGETTVLGGSLLNLLNAYCSSESGRTSIGSMDLDATIADGALVFSDGTNSGIYVHDVGSAGDTISFAVDFADTSEVGLWSKVAGTNVSSVPSSEVALDVSSSEETGAGDAVFVAHPNENGQLLVSKSVGGGAWEQVGGAIGGYGYGVHLEVCDGVPYVLFCRAADFAPVLYRYDGARGWVLAAQLSTTMSQYLDMTAGLGGLVIAYSEEGDGGSSNTLKVVRVDATGAVADVYADAVTPWTSAYHVSANSSSVYLSYRDVNTNAAHIRRFEADADGFTATAIEAPNASFSDSIICATDSIVFFVTDGNVGVRVYELTDGGWAQMGDSLTSTTSTSMNAALVNGMPIVQVLDQTASPTRTLVYKYADGAWVQEGLSVEMALVNDARMRAVDDRVYVAYLSDAGGFASYPVVKAKQVAVQPHSDPEARVEMTGIAVRPPTKTIYAVGEGFDATGMVVTAGYTDNSIDELGSGAYEVSGFDSSAAGEKTVWVSAGGFAESFVVTVEEAADPDPADPDPDPVYAPTLTYRAHVQNKGDIGPVSNGAVIGTTGSSLRMEAIYLTLGGKLGAQSGITCQAHVQNIGWMDPVSSGQRCGTAGQSKRIEALSIKLSDDLEAAGYHVYYRVHAQDVGWMGWTKDGARAGTAGNSLRLEAIQIVLVGPTCPLRGAPSANYGGIRSVTTHPLIDSSTDKPSGIVTYDAIVHIQTKGDTLFTSNGSTFLGTTGSSLRLEGLRITRFKAPAGVDLSVRYRTHIQDVGWQEWKTAGNMSGTKGRSLRLEAVTLQLTGADADEYDIYYRTHVQDIGWTGWALGGQDCGSAGYSFRMEAMQLVVVPKDAPAPGLNRSYFYQG